MPIQFLIRKFSRHNLFREALLKLINMEGNTLILSTAYIHNSYKENKEAAIEVLADAINKRLKKGHLDILILGGYKDTKGKFKFFCQDLNQKIKKNKNYTLTYKRVIGDNWHGKIAINLDVCENQEDNVYYSALVGSSNLTPVCILNDIYILNENKYNQQVVVNSSWNRETDLFIVNGNRVLDSSLQSVSDVECSIMICKKEVYYFINRINDCIEKIKEIEPDSTLYIVSKNKNKWRELEENSERVKSKIKYVYSQNKGRTEEENKSLHLHNLILQSKCEIDNFTRIEKQLKRSQEEVSELWKEFLWTSYYFDRECNKNINNECPYNLSHISNITCLINEINVLLDKEEELEGSDIEIIYKSLVSLQKVYKTLSLVGEYNGRILSCIEQVETLTDEIVSLRKLYMANKSEYKMKLDKGYLESLIASIYYQVDLIIENYTITESY